MYNLPDNHCSKWPGINIEKISDKNPCVTYTFPTPNPSLSFLPQGLLVPLIYLCSVIHPPPPPLPDILLLQSPHGVGGCLVNPSAVLCSLMHAGCGVLVEYLMHQTYVLACAYAD